MSYTIRNTFEKSAVEMRKVYTDTLSDMAVCLGGNLVFALLFPLDRLLGGRILPHLLPKTQ